MKKLLAAVSAVALSLAMAALPALSATATQPDGLLCTQITDGSYSPTVDADADDPFYVSIPAGYTLVAYCVKSGTEPVIVTLGTPVVGPASVQIDHPTKGSVSHYQLKLIPTVVVDLCDNIDGNQAAVPADKIIAENGTSCIDPPDVCEDSLGRGGFSVSTNCPGDDPTDVTVSGDATDQVCVPSTGEGSGTLTAGSIQLTVSDPAGIQSISYSTDGGTAMSVDPSGSLLIEDLAPGDYDFVVVAATGYEISEHTFTVTVKSDNNPACQKVEICHWNEGQGGGYVFIEVSKQSIINVPNGHKFHENDIIPAFTYEGGSFPGLNTTAETLEGCPGDPEELVVVVTEEHLDQECVVGEGDEPDSFTSGEIQLTVDPSDGVTKIEYRVMGSNDAWIEVDLNDLKVSGLAPGTYEFKVTVADDFTIEDATFDVTVAEYIGEDCQLVTLGPITPSASSKPATCEADGSYTLVTPPAEEGFPDPSVLWYVNGSLVPTSAGTHTVSAPASITAVAKAQPGYTFDDFTQERSFGPFVFTAPTTCELPTLALTGGSIADAALELSALLTLGGFLLLAARRRQKVDVQV